MPDKDITKDLECFNPMVVLEPFVLVIFGGTGDLSRNKLIPALFNLYKNHRLDVEFSILGIGSRQWDDSHYGRWVEEILSECCSSLEEKAVSAEFIKKTFYLSFDVGSNGNESVLCKKIYHLREKMSLRGGTDKYSGHIKTLFYLAVLPDIQPLVISKLAVLNVCSDVRNSKIVVEKPFGRDKKSCVELDKAISMVFNEKQVYRMDHFLGKDTVQNIMFFRFGNSIFEQVWNCGHIDHVQITVAEDSGIGNRAKFYEQTGVIRDVVQNHLLALLGLIAMEPPSDFNADAIGDEKIKVYKAVKPVLAGKIAEDTVVGRYAGGIINGREVCSYLEEKHVAPDSSTPTFFAGKFYIDNDRWQGVPFFVRAGKRMAVRKTEIFVRFKEPAIRLFKGKCDKIIPNSITFSIQPEEKISLSLNVKYPGITAMAHPSSMTFNYGKDFNSVLPPAYERLLLDIVKGDSMLFPRQDSIEAAWDIVDPIIEYWQNSPLIPSYPAGSLGPGQAEVLINKEGRYWND